MHCVNDYIFLCENNNYEIDDNGLKGVNISMSFYMINVTKEIKFKIK